MLISLWYLHDHWCRADCCYPCDSTWKRLAMGSCPAPRRVQIAGICFSWARLATTLGKWWESQTAWKNELWQRHALHPAHPEQRRPPKVLQGDDPWNIGTKNFQGTDWKVQNNAQSPCALERPFGGFRGKTIWDNKEQNKPREYPQQHHIMGTLTLSAHQFG